MPLRPSLPVLLISGEVDTATPPDAAERVARHLPNSRHIVFPNQSHDFANLPCESRIIADFIASTSPKALDTRCVAHTRRPPFLVPTDR
jgi:pimeloyl-ACP methyl ester carboxylesterase